MSTFAKRGGARLALATLLFVGVMAAQSLPNAVPATWPVQQFFDNAGLPLAGGKVCQYQAGTTTPQATYTDSTAATPNANPLILDSAGRGTMFFGANLYKITVLKGGDGTCSTGTVIWTADNYGDSTLYFTNYVKTVGTSSLITFTTPQTGGVSRTQYSKDQDTLSVKDFGAVGDGSTDDTAAINAAMAVSILGKGGAPGVCIYFPDGIYRITAALSYNHTVCMTGNQWRLKYTGSSTILAVLSLVGDPTNTYGSHGTYMEGSFIEGAILDGQGHATNGITLQGVVSADLSLLRATNVTGAGLNCNWCQQVNISHFMVSTDFETFTTTPTNGIIIDNISSDNYISNVNIDHVSGDGIAMKYALNTTIIGGTSEGNGGYGVNMSSGTSPFRQTYNNAIEQFDTEVNTAGDYCFCDTGSNGGVFNNSIFQLNSFSVPGITWSGGAHNNNIFGGAMGGGSTMGSQTYGNGLYGVGCVAVADPCLTDNGQNVWWTTIRNQSTGTSILSTNNYNNDMIYRNSSTSHYNIELDTNVPTFSDLHVGAKSTGTNWVGLQAQNGGASLLLFPHGGKGLWFTDEATYKGTQIPQGSIVSGNWGFGTYNTNPPFKFHFQDATVTTVVDQVAPGQGAADLHQFMLYGGSQDTAGTVASRIDYLGSWHGPVQVQGSGATALTYSGLVACNAGNRGTFSWITDANTNVWGGAVASGGGSNTVMLWCNGTGWTVIGK